MANNCKSTLLPFKKREREEFPGGPVLSETGVGLWDPGHGSLFLSPVSCRQDSSLRDLS